MYFIYCGKYEVLFVLVVNSSMPEPNMQRFTLIKKKQIYKVEGWKVKLTKPLGSSPTLPSSTAKHLD